ncbi:MAG: tetratricopeptide repeat protein [Pirellulaceae bacterium]|nr:tetratricopeptide repeat protein [Pirellulaceae bacterium]
MNRIQSLAFKTGCLTLIFSLGVCSAESPTNGSTPAEARMAAAKKAIAQQPKNVDAQNALAMALTRRARETADPDYYDQAREVLEESFRIEPDNFEARRIETWIALGKHEFSKALELARALSKRRPDDVLAYALLTDACVETGNYEEAERAAQWALDMRPGEISGLTRAAYLRELFGDIQGSVDLMQSAYNKTAPAEVEDRAWILTQFAHLQLLSGKPEVAELALADAIKLFPGYHYALGNMVKVRTAQQRYEDAVSIAQEFIQAAPNPENLFVVGEALNRAGRFDEAKRVFADFETQAVAESQGTDNANRELVFYYVNHANKPADGLRIAKLEFARRQDVFTREAYAWALQANGEIQEARVQMDKALAVGIRDPKFFYHAGVIAQKNNDHEQAQKFFQESLKLAERSEVSELVRKTLELSRPITTKP